MLQGVMDWLGQGAAIGRPVPSRGLSLPSEARDEPVAAPLPDSAVWPAARIALTEQLWGDGYLSPGGPAETLHLARPLALNANASVLLLGAGLGGAARTLAREFGAWVTGLEADPDLASLAMARSTRAGLGRRAAIEVWYAEAPAFRRAGFHHAIALEPLRGAAPEPVLAALVEAVKPGGQIVMLDLVAAERVDPSPTVAAWARLENRPPELPTGAAVTRMLSRLGLDVRVAEDISDRHRLLALRGWHGLLDQYAAARPSAAQAMLTIAEAELWLRRLRLLAGGELRLMRWHAFRRMAH